MRFLQKMKYFIQLLTTLQNIFFFFIAQIPQDNVEVIVTEAIELWEKNGSQTRPEVT